MSLPSVGPAADSSGPSRGCRVSRPRARREPGSTSGPSGSRSQSGRCRARSNDHHVIGSLACCQNTTRGNSRTRRPTAHRTNRGSPRRPPASAGTPAAAPPTPRTPPRTTRGPRAGGLAIGDEGQRARQERVLHRRDRRITPVDVLERVRHVRVDPAAARATGVGTYRPPSRVNRFVPHPPADPPGTFRPERGHPTAAHRPRDETAEPVAGGDADRGDGAAGRPRRAPRQ